MSDTKPAYPLWPLMICIGLNSFLPVKGWIHIQVSSNAVKQDGLATLLCLVGGTNKPATVTQWLKDGLVIQTDGRISISPPLSYKLVISNAMPQDTGMYMCATEKGETATQHLVVYCPVTANSQSVVRAVFGGTATLRCDGKCYDYIIWAKNGFIVDSVEPERFHSPGNGSALYITNVSMSDNGSFICKFISLTTVHTEVQLLVIEPADEVTVSKSDSSASVGQSYEIHCEANGRPRPESVSWFNNSKALRSSSRVTTKYNSNTGIATMFITRLTRHDLSNIECRFKQELQAGQFSYINAIIPITPTGKPNPPTDLHTDVLVFSDFSVKVHLHWTPPLYSGNLHILTYCVTFWDNDQCRRSLFCIEDDYWLDGSTVSHQFELQRDANHTHPCFSIRSVNNEGWSVPSDIKCIGVTRFSLHTVPTGPEPDTPAPLEKYAKREFQFALENAEKPSFELLKVSVEAVTRALAALLSSLSSSTVLTDDMTVSSYTQVGGVVYYRGFILSPQADNILTNLSHYIQAGQAILHLYGSHSLVFITNCPVRVLDGVCRISTADSSTLGCGDNDGTTNSTLTYTTTVDSSAFSALCTTILSVLGGLLLVALLLLTVLIRRGFSRRKASLSEENECSRSPIKGSSYRRHDDTCTDGRHSLISISRIPTSNSFSDGVTSSDTNQSTCNQKVPGKSSHQRSNSSRDSAYSEAHLSDRFSDTVEQDGQERGVTTV